MVLGFQLNSANGRNFVEEDPWCMSWCERCGCVIALSAESQGHMMVLHCSDRSCKTRYFVRASYYKRKPIK